MKDNMCKKDILHSFGSLTSMHGIAQLSRAKSFKARFFWSGVCLIAMAIFLYSVSQLILKYFSYPVIVRVYQVRSDSTLLYSTLLYFSQ